jgi:signal transduction histidine kinase
VPQKEFMRDILASATHLVGIINSVLDLSRIEAGRIELEPVSVNLPAMVGQVLETLTLLAEEKHITLASAVAPEVETIVTDATKLRQVLYNYLSNAIKFTPDGGNVRLTARAESDEMVRIEVLDTGIGIAADDQSHLFQEFQQLDTGMSKRYPGTGLGLALTKRIVEAEGGSVGVASTPGEGSVFHAILPRRLSPKE